MHARLSGALASRAALAAASMLLLAPASCTAPDPSPSPTPTGLAPRQAASEDWATDMVECLSGRGWDVRLTSDGGFAFEYPEEQRDRYDTDVEDCHDEYGYDMAAPELAPDQIAQLYETYLHVAECVRGLGYDVPEPPSEQAFIEGFLNQRIAPWSPYHGFADRGDHAGLRHAEQECPTPDWP